MGGAYTQQGQSASQIGTEASELGQATSPRRHSSWAEPVGLFGKHRVLVRGRRLVDQIGGEVLFGLLCQPHPSLGHVDQQDPAARGNRFICDP
jgi:hypothetical protein